MVQLYSAADDKKAWAADMGTGGDSILISPRGESVKASADRQRRKGAEKNVLDDIMGNPDDFGDLGESDAESDGGRWEDTLKEPEHDTYVPEGLEEESDFLELMPNMDEAQPALLTEDNIKPLASQCGSKEHEILDGSRFTKGLEGGSCLPMKRKAGLTRYFVIKSLNHHNIEKSIECGIWATQAMNESILNEAFETVDKVLLIFSVNMSGHFQGYAQMTSAIGQRRARVWSEANWGGTFDVEWIQLHDLPFQKTVHLRNPLNSFKPVKISRDCQELTQEIGEALCTLIDEGAYAESRRFDHGDPSLSAKQLGMTANCRGIFRPIIPPMPALMYPANFVPPLAHEPYSLHMPVIRSTVSSPSASRAIHKQLKSSWSRSPKLEKGERDRSMDHSEGKDRDYLRGNTDALPEEDLLNMTYEEYLQRHGNRGEQSLRHQGGRRTASSDKHGGKWTSSKDLEPSNDQYFTYLANWYRNQQGTTMQNGCIGTQTIAGCHPGSQPL